MSLFTYQALENAHKKYISKKLEEKCRIENLAQADYKN
jgi:hypothetical protein